MTDPLEQLKGLVKAEEFLGSDDLPDEFSITEDDEWTQDGKCQHCTCVYYHIPTRRYFSIANSRSGSYHTDWWHSTPEVREVSRKVKMMEVVSWEPV